MKLLVDPQSAIVGPSGKRPGQSLHAGSEDCRDAAITRIQAEAESQGDNQIVASGKHKVPPSRADSGVDLSHALNAKRSRGEVTCRQKMVTKAATVARSILPARSETRTPRSAQMEQLLPRNQTLFTPEIEGMEPPKKFNPLPNLQYTMVNWI